VADSPHRGDLLRQYGREPGLHQLLRKRQSRDLSDGAGALRCIAAVCGFANGTCHCKRRLHVGDVEHFFHHVLESSAEAGQDFRGVRVGRAHLQFHIRLVRKDTRAVEGSRTNKVADIVVAQLPGHAATISDRPIDTKNDLSALVRLACEHFVGRSGLGKRQHIAHARGQFAGFDERRDLFEAAG
jgi:hypothetical protein